MKRLTMGGIVLQVPRTRDKTFLYTCNPTHINHKSNKIDHHLKIVDFYIQSGTPDNFLIEPQLGKYEPDIFFKDKSNNTVCVEIQITPISIKKMQEKVNVFVSEFGKNHDSKTFVLCSNNEYNKLQIPTGFRFKKLLLPNEIIV
jgi:hypothetical protein